MKLNNTNYFLILILMPLSMMGQTVVDRTEITKSNQNGVELTMYQGKAFTGLLTEDYENAKQKPGSHLKMVWLMGYGRNGTKMES